MAAPLKAGLPPDCQLASGYQIRLVALDPTTGTQVSGVRIVSPAFFVDDVLDVSTQAGPDNTPNPLLVPLSNEV